MVLYHRAWLAGLKQKKCRNAIHWRKTLKNKALVISYQQLSDQTYILKASESNFQWSKAVPTSSPPEPPHPTPPHTYTLDLHTLPGAPQGRCNKRLLEERERGFTFIHSFLRNKSILASKQNRGSLREPRRESSSVQIHVKWHKKGRLDEDARALGSYPGAPSSDFP